EVVADPGRPQDVDAALGEVRGEVGAVGVHDLPEQQLGAYADQFRALDAPHPRDTSAADVVESQRSPPPGPRWALTPAPTEGKPLHRLLFDPAPPTQGPSLWSFRAPTPAGNGPRGMCRGRRGTRPWRSLRCQNAVLASLHG